jgi:hypothetical protein
MQGICNLPCFHLLYKDRLGNPPPGTAATQSTQATGIEVNGMGNGDDEGEESKSIDLNF